MLEGFIHAKTIYSATLCQGLTCIRPEVPHRQFTLLLLWISSPLTSNTVDPDFGDALRVS